MPSTRCQQSLEIVSGLYSDKWGSKSCLNEWTLLCHRAFSCARPERVPFLFTFYIDNVIVRLKYYRLFRLKTTWGLNINMAWHVSVNFTDTIWIFFVCLLWLRLSQWITEENLRTKQRFLEIKRDIIEQKEHLLNKWMSSECKHMKIIKGKSLIWSLFLTCVTLLLGWLLG